MPSTNPSLREFLVGKPSPNGALPLVHSTILWQLEPIIDVGKLPVERCDVFQEDLVYTFYGLPRYKQCNLQPGTHSTSRPVCLVFKNGLISRAWKTFPFDSGAHHLRLYDAHIPPYIGRELFEIDGPGGDAARTVGAFFVTNEGYCLGSVALRPEEHLVASALWSLYAATGTVPFDQRAAAIEVIFNFDIELTPYLEALVVPLSWKIKGPPLFAAIQNGFGIHVETYVDSAFGDASDYRGAMTEATYRYARDRGYL
jgi:hypothetical protein